jgi:hypothetical protein
MSNRLTFKNNDGTWGIKTCNIKDFKGNMYGVACKLKDYEDTGLSPERVIEINEFYNSQLAKVLAELQEYQRMEAQGILIRLPKPIS